jgi:hypothetical protein
LRHIFSCNSPSGGVLCPAFTRTTNGQLGILQAAGRIFISGKFLVLAAALLERCAAVEESSKEYLALWGKHQQLEPVMHRERYHIKVGDSKGR